MTTTPPQATQDAVCEICRETCAKAVCINCRNGVPLSPHLPEFHTSDPKDPTALTQICEAAAIRALPTRAQDEGEPVSETYRLDEGERDRLIVEIVARFKTFGEGAEIGDNPIAAALKDRPLMFAMGVGVADVVDFILGYSRRTEDAGEAREIAAILMIGMNVGCKFDICGSAPCPCLDSIASALTAHARAAEDRARKAEAERDELFLFKQNMRLRNDPRYEAQAAIERAEKAEADARAAEERATRAEEILDWLYRRDGLGFDAHDRIERNRALRGQSAAQSAKPLTSI